MTDKNLQNLFEEDAEQSHASNDDLNTISQMAEQMCTILGQGIEKIPSMSADISDLMKWSRDKKLAELPRAKYLVQHNLSIAELVGALETRLKEYRRIATETLPEAMANVGGIGISTFTLANGYTISVDQDVRAALRADHKEDAFGWLNDNGLGDIIKNAVEVAFGRGEDERASTLLAYCQEHGFIAANNKTVNAMTLKAVVKDMRTKGVLFPTEFFVIHDEKKAVIKRKKEL